MTEKKRMYSFYNQGHFDKDSFIDHGSHFPPRTGPWGNQDGLGERGWPGSPVTWPPLGSSSRVLQGKDKGGDQVISQVPRAWRGSGGTLDLGLLLMLAMAMRMVIIDAQASTGIRMSHALSCNASGKCPSSPLDR